MKLVHPTPYPDRAAERDRWILERRPDRNKLDPNRPYAFFLEEERSATGEMVPTVTVLLTNRECPWRCLMCDLWRNTLTESVPLGAIPEQIAFALSQLPPARQIKLYNSGSFFDMQAIPLADYRAIAALVSSFERVIVECHPSLVNDRCIYFRDLVRGQLEVAMGLETVHPLALERLNKRMTLDQFAAKSAYLCTHAIDLRVFILLQPPFVASNEALYWAQRSLDFAFACGATASTLIATRAGNGATDTLIESGDFSPPHLRTMEQTLAYGISLQQGRVFADLWEVGQAIACPQCRSQRIARLATMNASQRLEDEIACSTCGDRG